ncbi:MAG TPA: monofunctional biosynthetic peptidoglycan transglycosylase [Syntrophorhabdaceae bacterium]|nr:monofunctional biosynthetic peptidoglycan transglycosylase [Syntrophorhabdaceae bacterium]
MAKRGRSTPGRFGFIRLFIVLVLVFAVCFAGFYCMYPDVSRLKKQNPNKTSFMEYREKEWKAKGKRTKIQRKWVSLPNISPYLIKAVIIAEDDKFWSHHGFDLDAIEKALEKNIEKGKFTFGGSTISQQLVKNLYLTPAKNPVRKLKEAIITWRVERTLSKRRILEIYLNVVEWGEGIFGAEAASMHYFGKPASGLSAEEASQLAAILPNPIRYRIDGKSKYAERRGKIIYDIMVRRGIVIPEYDEVIKTPQVDTWDNESPRQEQPGPDGRLNRQ